MQNSKKYTERTMLNFTCPHRLITIQSPPLTNVAFMRIVPMFRENDKNL